MDKNTSSDWQKFHVCFGLARNWIFITKTFKKQLFLSNTVGFLCRTTQFSLFFSKQPNLWLSGLWHLAGHQEVSGLRTGMKSGIFSFKFFKIVQIFQPFLSISANLEFISINLISLKVPPAQF